MIHILYFAWVREKLGRDEETLEIGDRMTVADLVARLSAQSPDHAAIFTSKDKLRVAVNQEFADWSAWVSPSDEVAFFPPVTGG